MLWMSAASLSIMALMITYANLYGLPQNTPNTPRTQVIAQWEDHQVAVTSRNLEEGQVQGLESTMEYADARAAIVANFLEKYNSPLTPHDYYGQKLVEIADRYQLDFRFLPAIMMEESNLCKNIPQGTYNCLGFGIHSGGTLGFENYEAGFERAAKELRANYVDQGRIKVSEIAQKYTASVDKWTNSVNQWMSEMKYDDRARGIQDKMDSSVLEFVR